MAKYSYFKLVDMLDEGVDDEAALIHTALKNGLTLSPDEAMDLIFYDTGAEQAILKAVKGKFTPEQKAEIDDFLNS